MAQLPRAGVLEKPEQVISQVGFDSVTDYVWIHHYYPPAIFPETPYVKYFENAQEHWKESYGKYKCPYFPNVSMAWDPTYRAHPDKDYAVLEGYAAGPTVKLATPAEFRAALIACRDFLAERNDRNRIITINSWNEWSEGSHLEPDRENGYAFLEALSTIR